MTLDEDLQISLNAACSLGSRDPLNWNSNENCPRHSCKPFLEAAREMSRAREKALEESGLSHGHITEAADRGSESRASQRDSSDLSNSPDCQGTHKQNAAFSRQGLANVEIHPARVV